MKRITYFILVFITITLFTVPCHAKKHTRTNVRYANGIVYSYDYYSHKLVIQTDDGNVWSVKTTEPLFNRVRVKFDTCGTRKVEDDRIIKISLIK